MSEEKKRAGAGQHRGFTNSSSMTASPSIAGATASTQATAASSTTTTSTERPIPRLTPQQIEAVKNRVILLNRQAQEAGLQTPQGQELQRQAQTLATNLANSQRVIAAASAVTTNAGSSTTTPSSGGTQATTNLASQPVTPQQRLLAIQRSLEAYRNKLGQVRSVLAQQNLTQVEREGYTNEQKEIIAKHQVLLKYLQETLVSAGLPMQQALQIVQSGNSQALSQAIANAIHNAHNTASSNTIASTGANNGTSSNSAVSSTNSATPNVNSTPSQSKSTIVVDIPGRNSATSSTPIVPSRANSVNVGVGLTTQPTSSIIEVKPVTAIAGPPSRPTITGGLAVSSPFTGTPGIQKAPNFESTTSGSGSNPNVLLSKKRIQELLSQIDPNERIEAEVEDILLEIADEFIESCTSFACRLAKHRKSDKLEVKDLQLHLERNWNIRVPGFAEDDIRSVRKPHVAQSHLQKVQAVTNAKQAR